MRSDKHLPNYTITDYQHWEGDWELIDGIPWSVRSSHIETRPARKYSKILVELVRRLSNVITQLGEVNCEVVVQLDWVINDNTILRPDIAITYNDAEDFISIPPVLVIEISSPYTALNDRNNKFEIYQEQGVPYYILVDPITSEYQIFVLTDGLYLQKNHLDTFEVHDNCSIHLSIADALREMNS